MKVKPSLYSLLAVAILAIVLIFAPQREETFVSTSTDTDAVEIGWVQSPDFLPEQVIEHSGYVTSYNPETLVPNWVYEEILPEEIIRNGGAKRLDEFVEDPYVDGRCSSTEDYVGSGYGRGHLAPAADFKYSDEAMAESFYMTNVAPQDKGLNAGAWNDLENQVRFWCKNYYKTTMQVVSGVIVEDGAKRIGRSRVAVPSYFWKVVCRKDTRSGNYEAIGFLFPNKDTNRPYTDFAVPIDEIEELTGLDLLHILSQGDQSRIESTTTLDKWITN